MLKRTLLALFIMLSLSLLSLFAQTSSTATKEPAKQSTAPAQKPAWERIPAPPLPAFHPVEPTRIELSNGMVIFLSEDHELPLIAATMRIRGGTRDEPANKVGMLDIYGDVWRTGGTKSKTGDQLDDELEARAAKIETDDNGDSTTISLNCLKQDFDFVFNTYLDLLRNPEFRQDKVDLVKEEMRSAIARRNDSIDSIAGREAVKLAYGKDNPYARTPEYATVDAVTREDLVAWHQQHVHPNNIILGIVGDFDTKQMEERLRTAFESWPKGPELPPFQTDFNTAKPGIYFIEKSDVDQSEIRMVSLGIERKNPDYYAVEVMNEVFGGGFSSRLFSRIRTKQGLAYAVYGRVGSSFDHPGITLIGLGTKSATTVEAINSLNEQIDDLIKTPPTPQELRDAKDAILNSFIFNFDTPEKVLREKMAYEFYHYPLNFLELYRTNIEKITSEDVARVAHKYVHKSAMPTLVVGNEAEMGAQKLSSLGPVTPIDITIPTAGAAVQAQPAPKASNAEGRALTSKFVQALGGAENVGTVQAIEQKTSSVRSTPQGDFTLEIDNIVQYPDHLYAEISTPMGKMAMAITASSGFMSRGGESGDLPATIKEDALNTLKRDMIAVAQHANDPQYVFFADGTQKVGDVETNVLKINAKGAEATWYIDPKTSLPVRIEYPALGQSGPVTRTIDVSAWKTFGGLNLYTQRTVSENGKLVSKDTINDWIINPKVDPNLWQKPAPSGNPPK